MILVQGIEAAAMRVDDALWAWVDDAGVFFRLPTGSVPDDKLEPTDATDVDVVRAFSSPHEWGPALMVRRGIVTKIHGHPFPNSDLFAAIETIHGELAWHAGGRWFVARAKDGAVVAAMLLPKEGQSMAVMPIVVNSVVWICSPTFGMRLRAPTEVLARVAPLAQENGASHPERVAKLEGLLARARAAPDVALVREGDGARIGASRVPLAQALLLGATCPADELTWRWIGPREPVVGCHKGEPVGYVMPLIAETAPGGDA